MDELKKSNLGNIAGSMDDLDLAFLGLLPTMEEEEVEDTGEISPLHDMDSLEFHLWMEEEVDREAARRLATKNKE